MPEPPQTLGLLALAELHERDRARGIDPRAYAATRHEPPAPPPASIRELMPAPDWEREERERQAAERERQQRQLTRAVEAELLRRGAVDERTRPAPKKRRWRA